MNKSNTDTLMNDLIKDIEINKLIGDRLAVERITDMQLISLLSDGKTHLISKKVNSSFNTDWCGMELRPLQRISMSQQKTATNRTAQEILNNCGVLE